MPAPQLRVLTLVAGAAALVAALSMAVIFSIVVAHIASSSYGATADFLAFYSGGHMVREGQGAGLYDTATLESAQRSLYPGDFADPLGFAMPVFVAWLFVPLSYVPFTGAYFLWGAVNLALLAVAMRLLARELSGIPPLPRGVFLATAALGMTSLATLAFGQLDFIVLIGLVLGYVLLRSGRGTLAGVPFALVLVKPHFLVGVGLLLLVRREWRTLGSLAAVGLPLLIVPALLTAPSTVIDYAQHLAAFQGAGERLSVNAPVMANWRGFVVSATNSEEALYWLPGLVIITVAALAIALPRLRDQRPGVAFDRAYGVAVLLPLVISPHLHTQSLVLLYLPVALALRAYHGEDSSAPRQQAAISLLLGLYAALFFLPFFAIQGLSLTVFLLIGIFLAAAVRWPAIGSGTTAGRLEREAVKPVRPARAAA
jgi:hypothetical protein